MFPIVLNVKALAVGVVGRGEGLARRLALLAEGELPPKAVFEDRLPSEEDLRPLNILFVAGLSEDESRAIAKTARTARILVNVEDCPAFCDFHVPAQIRRGDLLLTVSTSGRSPGLARALRQDLERRFGPEWDGKLDEVAHLRALWRSQGMEPHIVSERTREFLDAKGWLS